MKAALLRLALGAGGERRTRVPVEVDEGDAVHAEDVLLGRDDAAPGAGLSGERGAAHHQRVLHSCGGRGVERLIVGWDRID